jgi:DNA-binding response OmpR family regulator
VIEELLARIRAALRRHDAGGMILRAGGLAVDCGGRTAQRDGNHMELTRREFDLLAFMMINKGIVLTRDQILSNVWSDDFSGDAKIVDVYIRYLRNKVDEKYAIKLIHTVRGIGYLLKEYGDAK